MTADVGLDESLITAGYNTVEEEAGIDMSVPAASPGLAQETATPSHIFHVSLVANAHL